MTILEENYHFSKQKNPKKTLLQKAGFLPRFVFLQFTKELKMKHNWRKQAASLALAIAETLRDFYREISRKILWSFIVNFHHEISSQPLVRGQFGLKNRWNHCNGLSAWLPLQGQCWQGKNKKFSSEGRKGLSKFNVSANML